MKIQYGAEVTDKNGRIVGTVGHVVRDTWTGGVRKFVVRQQAPHIDLLVPPEDVLETTESSIMLRITADELAKKLGP